MFFKKQFDVIKNDSFPILIEEAWVENVWFNKINDGKVQRKKFGDELQLALKLNLVNQPLKANRYLFDWKLISLPDGVLASSNGMYTISLEANKIIPDTFSIQLIVERDTTQKRSYLINLTSR